jgi:hypothetical protein
MIGQNQRKAEENNGDKDSYKPIKAANVHLHISAPEIYAYDRNLVVLNLSVTKVPLIQKVDRYLCGYRFYFLLPLIFFSSRTGRHVTLPHTGSVCCEVNFFYSSEKT